MVKRALITGISGQDGYFLARLLLEKGYEVEGLARRNSAQSLGNIDFLPKEEKEKVKIYWGDISDYYFVSKIIREGNYDEIYHLAAQSFVGLSFDNPQLTYAVNIDGTLNIVNSIKDFSSKSKMYFAATSELFGKVRETPQTEKTPFYPRSPYGVSKLAGFWTCINYRESYDLFIANGILFNHESELRGPEFVTRKISLAVARIKQKKQKVLELGNLNAKRDWGHSREYVEGMWRILQQDKADDFVLSTGKTYSIREFVEWSFNSVGIELVWEGEGINEKGYNKETKELLVQVNPDFFRPAEVEILVGDNTKAKEILGWEPKIFAKELSKIMVESDMELISKE